MADIAATVQKIYEAFGSGNIPAILELVDADCQWESWADNRAQQAGVPWMVARTGPAGAGAFFGVVGSLELHAFDVLNVMVGTNSAAVEFVIEYTYAPTGKRLRDEEIHLWTFNEAGKVIRLRHYDDTAKHIEAATA